MLVLNKAFYNFACAVFSDVWYNEPVLFLVVVLDSFVGALYVALQTFCEARVIMMVG